MSGFSMVLLIAVAGGIGAGLRFVLDGTVKARVHTSLPPGTMLINVLGSFVLGVITGLAGSVLPAEAVTVLGTGLLGGFTTFSTASLETVTLARRGRWGLAAVNALGMLALAFAAAALGLWVGGLWT